MIIERTWSVYKPGRRRPPDPLLIWIPTSERLATPLSMSIWNIRSIWLFYIMRPNVTLRMSHLTTNSLSHQCPTHPAYMLMDVQNCAVIKMLLQGSYNFAHRFSICADSRLEKLRSASRSALLAGLVSSRQTSGSTWSNINLTWQQMASRQARQQCTVFTDLHLQYKGEIGG